MKNMKKMLVVAGIVALTSQIYLDIIATDFRISWAIIFLAIFLFLYRDLNIIQTGILTGVIVYIWRVFVYTIGDGFYTDVIWAYFPEIFFYASFGIVFSFLVKKNPTYDINKYFIIAAISDYLSNLIEIFIRVNSDVLTSQFETVGLLLLVALVRSGIVWLILNGLKYYRMLLLKEEHEKRYKKLIWLTSRLKTEMYWAEKNMDNIEKVMANAYELFESITLNLEQETWAKKAVTIAKDVHEIKKEFGMVVRGVEEITENKLQDQGMYFEDIIHILEESMKREASFKEIQIEINFQTGENFFTRKHYYLMSIFRNLVMNAMDAISISSDESKINFIHEMNNQEHIFRISDTGCGIKKEDLSYIFLPGFSTKINYSTGNINRGLGLSLVKDIVEGYLNGKIVVHSIEGEGTTFEIHILIEELEEVER